MGPVFPYLAFEYLCYFNPLSPKFNCSWISNTTVQITQKSVSCQVRNSTPFLFTPWPTSRTLVDVLDVLCLRARCLQAMSNLQILDIFNFLHGPRPLHNGRPRTK